MFVKLSPLIYYILLFKNRLYKFDFINLLLVLEDQYCFKKFFYQCFKIMLSERLMQRKAGKYWTKIAYGGK